MFLDDIAIKGKVVEDREMGWDVSCDEMLKKMKRFMLSDPFDYVKELLSVELAKNPSKININSKRWAFELRDDGEGYTVDEINTLISQMFFSDKNLKRYTGLARGMVSALQTGASSVVVESVKNGEKTFFELLSDYSINDKGKVTINKGTKITVKKSSRLVGAAKSLVTLSSGLETKKVKQYCKNIRGKTIKLNHRKINREIELFGLHFEKDVKIGDIDFKIGISELGDNSVYIHRSGFFYGEQNFRNNYSLTAIIDNPDFNLTISGSGIAQDDEMKKTMNAFFKAGDELYLEFYKSLPKENSETSTLNKWKIIHKREKNIKLIKKYMAQKIDFLEPAEIKESSFLKFMYTEPIFETFNKGSVSLKDILLSESVVNDGVLYSDFTDNYRFSKAKIPVVERYLNEEIFKAVSQKIYAKAEISFNKGIKHKKCFEIESYKKFLDDEEKRKENHEKQLITKQQLKALEEQKWFLEQKKREKQARKEAIKELELQELKKSGLEGLLKTRIKRYTGAFVGKSGFAIGAAAVALPLLTFTGAAMGLYYGGKGVGFLLKWGVGWPLGKAANGTGWFINYSADKLVQGGKTVTGFVAPPIKKTKDELVSLIMKTCLVIKNATVKSVSTVYGGLASAATYTKNETLEKVSTFVRDIQRVRTAVNKSVDKVIFNPTISAFDATGNAVGNAVTKSANYTKEKVINASKFIDDTTEKYFANPVHSFLDDSGNFIGFCAGKTLKAGIQSYLFLEKNIISAKNFTSKKVSKLTNNTSSKVVSAYEFTADKCNNYIYSPIHNFNISTKKFIGKTARKTANLGLKAAGGLARSGLWLGKAGLSTIAVIGASGGYALYKTISWPIQGAYNLGASAMKHFETGVSQLATIISESESLKNAYEFTEKVVLTPYMMTKKKIADISDYLHENAEKRAKEKERQKNEIAKEKMRQVELNHFAKKTLPLLAKEVILENTDLLKQLGVQSFYGNFSCTGISKNSHKYFDPIIISGDCLYINIENNKTAALWFEMLKEKKPAYESIIKGGILSELFNTSRLMIKWYAGQKEAEREVPIQEVTVVRKNSKKINSSITYVAPKSDKTNNNYLYELSTNGTRKERIPFVTDEPITQSLINIQLNEIQRMQERKCDFLISNYKTGKNIESFKELYETLHLEDRKEVIKGIFVLSYKNERIDDYLSKNDFRLVDEIGRLDVGGMRSES
ncbi:MAG: hypothetical protein ABIC91_03005 [Nanoarchaeota archaeon]|nr:trichohyalin-plectin-homology domain domain-containing protein [Nanoarchaeota archaeon]MBU1030283.1 trichohyalin-plectin-homology domain domain-containing protein [Nanoarchaeota archaeon]